jgi:DNA-binding MarR family transcriptional regulator
MRVFMRTEDIRRHRKQAREFHRATGGFLGDSVCCGGVSVPQCHVLLELDESGSTSLVALAEALGLDKSTVSRTVESLVSRGLVDRTLDSEDRRYVVLDLTDAGRATAKTVNATADENVRKIFSHVPQGRRSEVVECFGLLVAAVRAADAEATCPDREDDVDEEKSA